VAVVVVVVVHIQETCTSAIGNRRWAGTVVAVACRLVAVAAAAVVMAVVVGVVVGTVAAQDGRPSFGQSMLMRA